MRYTVRFDYADGQQYDSGSVEMTMEQADKVQALLEALEADERISETYVGEYHEWESPLSEVVSTLRDQFKPDAQDVAGGFVTPEIKAAWAGLEGVL